MSEVLRPSEAEIRIQALTFPDIPETVAIGDTKSQYPNEWILMRVTAYDLQREPTHGFIVDHSEHRGRISQTVENKINVGPRVNKTPGMIYYIYNTTHDL